MRHRLVRLVVLAGLLLAGCEAASAQEPKTPVLLWMHYPATPTACPVPATPPPRQVSPGVYEAGGASVWINSIACFSPSRTVREEWTDYPERGGRFLRVVTP